MILADKPLWPWRGQLWGHLVSDTSLEELHEFARQLGKRRIGFQGDHYDLNPTEHARALEFEQAAQLRDSISQLKKRHFITNDMTD